MSKIYVASSWRCSLQPKVVRELGAAGHEIYDFRNPREKDHGFSWKQIDPQWEDWSPGVFRRALEHDIAKSGFGSDFDGMTWADACVLVLPCGRSAHLEAGWFVGAGKPLHILIMEHCEPELMYKMATSICLSVEELLGKVALSITESL